MLMCFPSTILHLTNMLCLTRNFPDDPQIGGISITCSSTTWVAPILLPKAFVEHGVGVADEIPSLALRGPLHLAKA